MKETIKLILIVILVIVSVSVLYKWWIHGVREKSCRDFASGNLEIDSKYPLKGQETTSGYHNIGKYEKMYKDCMFLQGY